MLFLLNNPVVMIIGIFLIGLLGWVSYLIIREIQFNNILKEKHGVMRVEYPKNKTFFNRRLGLLGGSALAPVIVLVLIFVLGSQETISPTGETELLSDSNDIEMIYSKFQDYLAPYESPQNRVGEEEVVDDASEPDVEYDETPSFSDGMEAMFPTADEKIGWDEVDNVISDDIYVYQVLETEVKVSLYNSPSYSLDELPEYKVITPDLEDLCDVAFTIDSIYVDSNYLSVSVGYEDALCDVELFVYDKTNDFALNEIYTLSGDIVAVKQNEGSLVVVTSDVIDYEVGFDINGLPYYILDDVKEEVLYEDILYYDATYPYAFTSIYHIDLVNNLVDMEVLLGDYNSYLYITDNHLYLVGYLYYFEGLAEFFELESPVETIHSMVVKYDVESDVTIVSSSEINGVMLEELAIKEYGDYLAIATTTALEEEVVNYFYVLDNQMNVVSVLDTIGLPNEHIDHVKFYSTEVYVYFTITEESFQIIDIEDILNPKIK